MKKLLLARRYAKAFLYKPEESAYESLLDDCTKLDAIVRGNDNLMKILRSRFTARAVKAEIFGMLVNETGNHELWKGLFDTVLHNKREVIIPEILFELDKILLEKLDKLKMTIELARNHQQGTIDKIKHRFEKMFSKEILLKTRINPQIIGGFVGLVGNTRIDGSIKHSLDRFKKEKTES